MTDRVQRDWETERILEGRCPKCGSSDTSPTDYSYDPETGEDSPYGIACDACDYEMFDDNSAVPFIAPGKPGSHDQPGDYDDD